MILVTGATGHLGEATIDFLLQKTEAANIAALVRNESKADNLKKKGIDIRYGDYTKYDSLLEAFKGIKKLMLISSNDLKDRAGQHINAIKAAKAAGVEHVLYTSFQRKTENPSSPIWFIAKDHIETEKFLKESSLIYSIFKNGFYMDMIPDFAGNVLETGKLIFPAGEGKVSCILRKDIAEVLANVLLKEGFDNKEIEVANSRSYSFSDVARTIGKVTNREIEYFSPDPNEFKKQLLQAKVPPMMAEMSTAFAVAFSQGEMDLPDDTAKQILGRDVTTLEEYLERIYNSNKQ